MKLLCLHLACLGLMAAAMPGQAAQEEAGVFQQDGWYRWQIDTVQAELDWCCYSWKGSQPGRASCDLDGRDHGFSSSNRSRTDARYGHDVMDIYANIQQGKISDLRAFSPDCPVQSDGAINDLGQLEVSRSLDLLEPADLSGKASSHQRIAVLAVHAGPEAGAMLARLADASNNMETRKQAVFWMAQLHFAESRDQLLQIMADDPSDKLREHTAFSYAQSDAPDRIEVLIEIIEDRQREFSDRSNALFWLAESGETQGVNYIQKLLTAR